MTDTRGFKLRAGRGDQSGKGAVRASGRLRFGTAHMLATILVSVVLLAGATCPATAASSASGGTESVFSLGAGSRALGMGGAFTAVSDDATALYWNPAGLPRLEQTSVAGFHSTLFEGSSYDFFSVCQPTVRFGSFGFAFIRVGTGGIQAYDSRSRHLGEIDFSQSEMLFSYGREALFDVRVGASLKIVSERMGDHSAGGVGFDLGAMYPIPYLEGFTLGLALRDVPGAKLKLVERVERTPRTVRIGAAYRGAFRDNQDAVTLAADASLPERAPTAVSLGGEYLIDNLVALRMGLKEGKFTAGAGVRWRDYSFDYSMGSTELGSLHQFSVSAAFGDPVAIRRQREVLERQRDVARMLKEERSRKIDAHMQLAREAFAESSYSAALEEWNLVLEYEPGNAEAAEGIGRARQALAEKTEQEARRAELQVRVHVLVELGREFLEQGELRLALLKFGQASRLEPENQEVSAWISRADSLVSNEVSARVEQARQLAASGKHLEAFSAWNRVLLLEPDNPVALAGLDESKKSLESMDENLAEARRRIDALGLYTRAVRAYERGDYQDAKAMVNEVLRLYPADKDALRFAERIEERLSPPKPKVEEDIRELYVEGMNHFNSGEYEKAIESWQKILEMDPDNEMVTKNIEKAKARLSSGERTAQ
ncbi:MAG: PorV/PorQ family protein [Candidatus Eiseniibacteriota bacterium]|nr:MAG: PorV/PorQ family protein [Candidatus Eisenbacteria bacterium]